MKNIRYLLFLIAVLVVFVNPAHAQGQWEYGATMYIWAAGLDGNVAAVGRTVEVSQDFGDILDNLEFSFTGAFRAYNGKWAVQGDFLYLGLGATIENPARVEVDVDQWMITGDIGYQIVPRVEVLAGARVVSVQNKLQFEILNDREFEADKTWVDPIIGIRLVPRLSDSVDLWTRFDFGGFDIGSDFTWQFNTNLVWHFSDRAGVTVGYRLLDINYDDEDGNQEFVYDALTHGPTAGMVFSF